MEQAGGGPARFFYAKRIRDIFSFLGIYGQRLRQIFDAHGIDTEDFREHDDEILRKILYVEKEFHFIYAIKQIIEDNEKLILNIAKGVPSEIEIIRKMSCKEFIHKLEYHINGLRQGNNTVGT